MMGVEDPDHQILLEAVRGMRKQLVGEVKSLADSGDTAIAAAILSAVVNVETIDEIAKHSRALVGLTRALVVLSLVLGFLTVALLLRTFG